MNWLNIKTEFSFGSVFGHTEEVVQILKKQKSKAAGIADLNGTYGFIQWSKYCEAAEIKPIFGVKLAVVFDLQEKDRRGPVCEMTFIALTNAGLQQIYKLVELAHSQSYYVPRISAEQVSSLPHQDVVVLSGVAPTLAMTWDIKRPLYIQMSPDMPLIMRKCGIQTVACIDNNYPRKKDRKIYEPFADSRLMEKKTTPQWILTDQEWLKIYPGDQRSLDFRDEICKKAEAKLQKAPFIKFPEKVDIEKEVMIGAAKAGINLKKKKYRKRINYEMDLIREKGFEDYFMLVADIISWSKKQGILVGPGRGSAGGSLVAYCLGITTVDPLKYDLIFERFIDINRTDLPDIDVDFPDVDRPRVLKYISKKYGEENVSQISNINKLQAKSALNRVIKNFGLDGYIGSRIKNVMIERTAGDSNANDCLKDTIKSTKEGEALMRDHPYLKVATRMEGHASHTGVHAAGILVSNHPISDFCSVNTKDKRVAMIDMREAEDLNLLKIDALGLRTLSILADVLKAVGKSQEWLYSLPDGNKKAYDLLNSGRYTGIFQLEGKAARQLAADMDLQSIEDLAALSAIARPGPLDSGGAHRYVKRKANPDEISYTTDHKIFKKITKATAGVIIYQEQVMRILKDLGQLSWKDTIFLRKQMAKTMGVEAFNKYKKKFSKGAVKNGLDPEEAGAVWETLVTFGKYGFNKSHSVAYSIISYWCAYLKAKWPMEFAVACLNNQKSDRDSILLLRDLDQNEGIKHVFFDKEISQLNWSHHDGKLYGGYLSLHGLGPVKAAKAVKAIQSGSNLPAGIQAAVESPISPFEFIYPARQLYGEHYDDKTFAATEIQELSEYRQIYKIIGSLEQLEGRSRNGGGISTNEKMTSKDNDLYYRLVLEDDTGQITCFPNEQLVDIKELEDLEAGKDWLMMVGELRKGLHAEYFVFERFKKITIGGDDE